MKIKSFIEFLKQKCIEETGCIKDNWEDEWENFISVDEEERLSKYAEEWRNERLYD